MENCEACNAPCWFPLIPLLVKEAVLGRSGRSDYDQVEFPLIPLLVKEAVCRLGRNLLDLIVSINSTSC